MGKFIGPDDFVITNVLQGYGFNGTSYQIVTLKDTHGNILHPICNDGSYKLESLCIAARGTREFSVSGDLIGRVVNGTVFKNLDEQGNGVYNVDYFQPATQSYLCDMFFFYPEDTWSEQEMNNHYNRLDYVGYLKNMFDYDIPSGFIEASKTSGPHK